MAAFTQVIAGVDWSQISIIDEIRLALHERTWAWQDYRAYPSFVALESGTDIQDHVFWSTMQQQCMDLAPKFVNHTLSEPSQTAFTFQQICQLAGGGVANGFRRSQDGSAFGTGLMQRGDIIGPWIFQDLQAVLSMMKWTWTSYVRWTGKSRVGYYGYAKPSLAEAIQDATSSFLSAETSDMQDDWSPKGYDFPTSTGIMSGGNPGSYWYLAYIQRNRFDIVTIPFVRPYARTWQLYTFVNDPYYFGTLGVMEYNLHGEIVPDPSKLTITQIGSGSNDVFTLGSVDSPLTLFDDGSSLDNKWHVKGYLLVNRFAATTPGLEGYPEPDFFKQTKWTFTNSN